MASQPLLLTHIGGPTALIEFGGVRLLTDPTFDPAGDEYPSGSANLRKLSEPALSAAAIGLLDYVLLSHDHHFDNLDRTGRSLLSSAKATLTTEEGAGRLGGNSIGLKAWQSMTLPTRNGPVLRVVATPARHGPQGRDRGAVIGFVVSIVDAPDQGIYLSGDTVWYEGVAEVARRYTPRVALLNLGAASVPEVGPFHLTMTASEAVEAAGAFVSAAIVPLHFEGWAHFTEGREEIAQAFAAADLSHRLRWPELGRSIQLDRQSAAVGQVALTPGVGPEDPAFFRVRISDHRLGQLERYSPVLGTERTVMLGLVAFGIGAQRAKVLPRYAAVALMLWEPGSIATGLLLAPISPLHERGTYSAGVWKGLAMGIVSMALQAAGHQRPIDHGSDSSQ